MSVATSSSAVVSPTLPLSSNKAGAASVKLEPTMSAKAIMAHLEHGRTDLDTVVAFAKTCAYPIAQVAQLAGVLGAEFAAVLEAQQSMAVVREVKAKVKAMCTITKAEFLANASPLEVTLAGVPMVAAVKEFSTGSFGWNLCGKLTVKVDDQPVQVQVGLNLTVIGSKTLG